MSKKFLCVLSGLAVGISAFLPYLTVSVLDSSVSVSLSESADGYILIGFAVIAIIFSLIGKYIPTIIMGMASIVFFFIANGNIASKLYTGDSVSRAIAKSLIHNGAGYYCLLIGSIALIIFGFIAYRGKKAQE